MRSHVHVHLPRLIILAHEIDNDGAVFHDVRDQVMLAEIILLTRETHTMGFNSDLVTNC